MAKARNPETKLQVVSVLINHETKQFFITYNNIDAIRKGLKKMQDDYHWLKHRLIQHRTAVLGLNETPSVHHRFDSGLNWAFEASKDTDWIEHRSKVLISYTDIPRVSKKWEERLTRYGYVNVRSLSRKAPSKKEFGEYKWGKWNPNIPLHRFKHKMDSLQKAMNLTIKSKIISDCWCECVRPNGVIQSLHDVWEFFNARGVFNRDPNAVEVSDAAK